MNKRRLQMLASLVVTALVVGLGSAAIAVATGRVRKTMEKQIARDSGLISQNLRILIRQATREFSSRDAAVDRVQRILEEMHVQGWRGFACVVDENGKVIAHPNSGMQGHEVSLRSYRPTELGLQVGGGPEALLGSETRDPAIYRTDADIIAIQWLPDLMTYLCVHQPHEEVTERLAALMSIVRRIGIGFLLLAATSTWYFVGILVDRYETRLSLSEARNRALVESSDPIWVTDANGKLLDINPAGALLIGTPPEEAVGLDLADFWPPADLERLGAILSGTARGNTSVHQDLSIRTVDGRTVPVSLRACRVDYGSRDAIYLLLRDVTESVRARNEILEANRRLRELDRLKSDFLNTVSHELRTPLTSIEWSADSLARLGENWDDPGFAKLLSIIRDDNRRLSRLIEQLLSFSRIEAGKLQPRLEPTDLMPLLAHAAESLATAATRKEISISLPDVSVSVRADTDQLRQVFTNLIDNAIKYTPSGGQVSVTVAQDPSGVVVSLSDTGIGIPEGDREKVFERFYRVDQDAVRRENGTGLGLAIVRGIVRSHGGDVVVQSEIGTGTTFHVHLPFSPSPDRVKS